MKDQFVFVAAHELRTPANAIRWALESLEIKKSPFIEEEKEIFNSLEMSCTKLLDLVKDLLEVSRIETGGISIHLQPIPIAEVLKESLASLAVRARPGPADPPGSTDGTSAPGDTGGVRRERTC